SHFFEISRARPHPQSPLVGRTLTLTHPRTGRRRRRRQSPSRSERLRRRRRRQEDGAGRPGHRGGAVVAAHPLDLRPGQRRLYFVAVERQAQNRARAVAEGLKALDGAGGGAAGEDV
ncbi:unnamed protein product, partial [Urochloa humidicola]